MYRICAALALATLAACSESIAPECRVGADCASGACSRDGVCLPPNPLDAGDPPPDASVDAGITSDVDAGFDDAGNPIVVDAGAPDAGEPPVDAGGCQPNADGILERREVVMGAGLRATYRIAQSVSVDTAGVELGDGRRRWDFSAMLAGDHRVEITTDALDGRWFAPDFPTATYASRLSDSSSLLGVFEVTDTSLLLLGVVSPTESDGTNVAYETPIEVLQFPLQLGKTWTSESWVSGTFDNLSVLYLEEYTYEVSAEGSLSTPFSTDPFEVLRVSVELTKSLYNPFAPLLPPWSVSTLHTQSYLAECFGPVAAVTSEEDETNAEFTSAAELRRLAP